MNAYSDCMHHSFGFIGKLWRLAFWSSLTALLMTVVAAQAQDQTSEKPPENIWLNQEGITKLGKLCVTGARRGDVTLGFMTMEGMADYRGFVIGLVHSAVQATWQVDTGQPVTVNGKLQRDDRWVSSPLPPEFLTEITTGSQLTVTSATGQHVVVDLIDASKGVASFTACQSGKQADTSIAQLEDHAAGSNRSSNQSRSLTDSELEAGKFIAALDAVNASASGERSGAENLSPRDIVNEAHEIYEELINLPATEEGLQKAWALEKRLDKITGVTIGMRNSPDWEAMSDVFFRQDHLLGLAISTKRNEIVQKLKAEAPQRLNELRTLADQLSQRHASEIASLGATDEFLDGQIVRKRQAEAVQAL